MAVSRFLLEREREVYLEDRKNAELASYNHVKMARNLYGYLVLIVLICIALCILNNRVETKIYSAIQTNYLSENPDCTVSDTIKFNLTGTDNNYESCSLSPSDITVLVGEKEVTPFDIKLGTITSTTNGVTCLLELEGVPGEGQLKIKIAGGTLTDKAGNVSQEATLTTVVNMVKAGAPVLMTGMTPVTFTGGSSTPTDTIESDSNWYDYANQKWPNARTADGSLWVWIPRFEYKIDSTNKKFDVKIIKETQTTADSGYIIHPAFINDKSNNYMRGGWRSELSGIWVAKFPAGYVTSGYTDSGVAYTGTCANNYYGTVTSGSTTMKYPVFKGQTYAYNYINIGSSYNLSRNLTKSGNPYGLSSSSTDSHQMKNSEWGAMAYFTQSQYGLNGTEPYINNVNLNNKVSTIYAVTGYTADSVSKGQNSFSSAPASLGDSITGSSYTSYAWYTTNGQKGSSTGNMYGVYDISGCVWERVSGYITNGNGSLSSYGSTFANTTASTTGYQTYSTEYATAYPYNSSSDSNTNNWTTYNGLKSSTYGYGDAVLETSTSGSGSNSWASDYSNFPHTSYPFFVRGGNYDNTSGAGVFAFNVTVGNASHYCGFRAVLVAQ